MRKGCLLIACLLILTFSVGCSCFFPDASKFGEEYYQNIQTNNYQQAIELCSDKYFEKIPEREALRLLETVNDKLGDVVSYKLVSTEGKSSVGSGGSYSRFILVYEVKYERGFAKETLVVGKQGVQTELQLWDYSIDSTDLIFSE